MAVTIIEGATQVAHLAKTLQSKRTKPSVVVSSTRSRDDSWVPVDEIARDLGDLADVYWIPNGESTWEFAKHMPPDTQVFGEAGRVYCVDNQWLTQAWKSRLYIAFDSEDGKEIAANLSAEALHDASLHGLIAQRANSDVSVEGVIKSVIAGRGIAQIPQGFASVVPEFVLEGVPAERLIQAGQTFRGLFNKESGQLNLSPSVVRAADALTHYREQDVVLARVKTLGEKQVSLELFPGVQVDVQMGQITGNPLDSAYDLMTKDEIVRARVTRLGPKWRLAMTDVDDDEESVTAPAFLLGGPPLYVLEEHEFTPPAVDESFTSIPSDSPSAEAETLPSDEPLPTKVAEPESAPAVIAVPHPGMFDPARSHLYKRPSETSETKPAEPAPVAQTDRRVDLGAQKHMANTIASLKSERDALEEETRQLRIRALGLQEKLNIECEQTKRLRTQQRKTKQQIKQDSRGGSSGAAHAFADPEQQFRHDIYMVWVDKIPAQEKDRLPLPEYLLGEHFLDTLSVHTPDIKKKALEVVAEVLTGTAERSAGRDVHPLRGGSPTAPPVTRNNGLETCMRVAVKIGAPSAPRLHYWKGGETLELSSVRLHDDMQP